MRLSDPQLHVMRRMRDEQSICPRSHRLRVTRELVRRGLVESLGGEWGLEYFGLTDKGREALAGVKE